MIRGKTLVLLVVYCVCFLSSVNCAFPQSIELSKQNLGPGYVTPPNKNRVIVFVHGIFGDAKGTRTCKSGARWPLLLRKDKTFNDFDIYIAQYETPYRGNKMTIDQIVNSLNQHLINDEVFSKHQEVVFVAHSLGGLI